MIDKTGRALVHPLLPDATYVKLEDEPLQGTHNVSCDMHWLYR
jgi:hypothetical protein